MSLAGTLGEVKRFYKPSKELFEIPENMLAGVVDGVGLATRSKPTGWTWPMLAGLTPTVSEGVSPFSNRRLS
jgi:hypothetical protein